MKTTCREIKPHFWRQNRFVGWMGECVDGEAKIRSLGQTLRTLNDGCVIYHNSFAIYTYRELLPCTS